MSDLLLMLVFLPMAAGPFGFWMGLRYPKARDTFVLAVAVLETMMVVSLWTSPVLESGIDGFCGLGIRFVSGDFHTLMATLTATGWLAATIFCREYMAHVARQNRQLTVRVPRQARRDPGIRMTLPLITLSVGSVALGLGANALVGTIQTLLGA